jgi:hypothetical protein
MFYFEALQEEMTLVRLKLFGCIIDMWCINDRWITVQRTSNMQPPTTTLLGTLGWSEGVFIWGGYKMAGPLGREHQGRVCRFVKILAKGSPKDY